jgi:hypothetical protein
MRRDVNIISIREAQPLTRRNQKAEERFYPEQAARSLSRLWTLGNDREHPDFVVNEDGWQFGLEVMELLTGSQGAAGSALKAGEARTQRTTDKLRREYESNPNSAPLVVRFVGNMEPADMATVVPALVEKDLASRPVGHKFVHDTTVKYPFRARLRVHVTRAIRPDWCNILDRAGFVNRAPRGIIADAIAKKAAELPRYTQAAGGDIRLLLVTNCISNSGKLTLDEGAEFEFHGFSSAYLYPYPEDVIVLGNPRAPAGH